jgi:hypothetical protein
MGALTSLLILATLAVFFSGCAVQDDKVSDLEPREASADDVARYQIFQDTGPLTPSEAQQQAVEDQQEEKDRHAHSKN